MTNLNMTKSKWFVYGGLLIFGLVIGILLTNVWYKAKYKTITNTETITNTVIVNDTLYVEVVRELDPTVSLPISKPVVVENRLPVGSRVDSPSFPSEPQNQPIASSDSEDDVLYRGGLDSLRTYQLEYADSTLTATILAKTKGTLVFWNLGYVVRNQNITSEILTNTVTTTTTTYVERRPRVRIGVVGGYRNNDYHYGPQLQVRYGPGYIQYDYNVRDSLIAGSSINYFVPIINL